MSKYSFNPYKYLDFNKSNTKGSQIHKYSYCKTISLSSLGLTFSGINNSKITATLKKLFKKRTSLFHALKTAKRFVKFKRLILDSSIIREDNSDYVLTQFMLELSKTKFLEKLDCLIFPCSRLTSDGIKNMCHFISKLRQLQRLSIAYNWCYQVIDNGISSLATCIVKLAQLKILNLTFFNCQNLSSYSIVNLGLAIRKKTQLETLSFTLGRASPQVASGLSSLWSSISLLTNLKKLNFTLVTIEVQNNYLKSLADSLVCLKDLEVVELNFLRCSEMSDKGLAFIRKALKSMANLREVSLNNLFCDEVKENDFQEICQINSKYLTKLLLGSFREKPKASNSLLGLAKNLKNHLGLRELKLYFGLNRPLKKNEIMELADAISLLSKLTKLNISIPYESKFDDKSLALLMNPISNLDELREITLNLSSSLINDNSIFILSDYLNERTNLTLLSLNFSDCLKLTDEGMMYISGTLVLFKKLRSLKFNVARCGRITEKGIACLGNAMKSLKCLTELDIDFSLAQDYSMFLQAQTLLFHEVLAEVLKRTNANRTDECLINLCVGLSELKNLRKLRVSFKGCSFISDRGIIQLCDSILEMKYLTELDLDLQSCLGITNNTVDKLSSVLTKMKHLNTVNLVFLENTEITDGALTHLFIRLEDIPIVIICSSLQTLLKPRLSWKVIDLIALCK